MHVKFLAAAIGFALSAGLLVATNDVKSRNDPSEVFDRLKTLVGDWEGTFPGGKTHRINIRLTAGDTVLVETWALGPNRESMTLYHMDDESLVATHYCPQGNQPRLQYVPAGDGDKFNFRFRDGTNLKRSKGTSHQHLFWIQLLDEKTFLRSELYVKNGSNDAEVGKLAADEPVKYRRVETPAAIP
ncbi:MAG: hypothetical protein ACJ8C4_08675 [Gemmataceae bacterium]